MPYQSPISPGYSWYETSVGERPEYPALDGDRSCDVVIIGGGFTGLSAAAHLAKAGTSVTLIEAYRFGDGASGRNGGQLGTGQRAWAEELEAEFGFTRAKALFDLAEEAKAHLLEFAEMNGIDIEYVPRPNVRGAQEALSRRTIAAHAEIMADALRLSAYPVHGRGRDGASASARRAISAARAIRAPAISSR